MSLSASFVILRYKSPFIWDIFVGKAKKKRLQHLSFAYGLPLHYSVRLLAA